MSKLITLTTLVYNDGIDINGNLNRNIRIISMRRMTMSLSQYEYYYNMSDNKVDSIWMIGTLSSSTLFTNAPT